MKYDWLMTGGNTCQGVRNIVQYEEKGVDNQLDSLEYCSVFLRPLFLHSL